MSRKLIVRRLNNVLFTADINDDDEVQMERTEQRGWNIHITRPVEGKALEIELPQEPTPVEPTPIGPPATDKASPTELKKAAKKSTAKKAAAKKRSKK